ncbi:MAG: glycosyltransferase N-terminal domain-containing protein [Steroidobacteraceae bacterium]
MPVVYASARVSARSAAAWGRWPSLLAPLLARGVSVAAQSADDAARFRALGVLARRSASPATFKFEREVPPETAARGAALRERYAAAGQPRVAGTREGEEAAARRPRAWWRSGIRRRAGAGAAALAGSTRWPRFPSPPRAAWLPAALGAGVAGAGMAGAGVAGAGAPRVVLLDTLGELLDFYAAADVAFVGGSLASAGGHNLLGAGGARRARGRGAAPVQCAGDRRGAAAGWCPDGRQDATALAGAVNALLDDAAARAPRRGRARRGGGEPRALSGSSRWPDQFCAEGGTLAGAGLAVRDRRRLGGRRRRRGTGGGASQLLISSMVLRSRLPAAWRSATTLLR